MYKNQPSSGDILVWLINIDPGEKETPGQNEGLTQRNTWSARNSSCKTAPRGAVLGPTNFWPTKSSHEIPRIHRFIMESPMIKLGSPPLLDNPYHAIFFMSYHQFNIWVWILTDTCKKCMYIYIYIYIKYMCYIYIVYIVYCIVNIVCE